MKSIPFGVWALLLLAAGCGPSRQSEDSATAAPPKAIWQSQPI
ncbi:MAG TPA: hypothetical protein VMH27_21315 [Puia sp.]|nr:hypothetical protein [Puia sp.]